jgi:hypothetical protein
MIVFIVTYVRSDGSKQRMPVPTWQSAERYARGAYLARHKDIRIDGPCYCEQKLREAHDLSSCEVCLNNAKLEN